MKINNISSVEFEQMERMQGAVQLAATGAQIALQLSSGSIPGVLLDATITLGRVAFEMLSAVAPANTEDIRSVMAGIVKELDRLDTERVVELEGGAR